MRRFAIWGGVFLVLFGISLRYALMRDSLCFPYLGCNIGLFGYDGLLHLANGVALPFGFIWLSRGRIRDPLYLISLVALVAIGWEASEFAYDHIRIIVFHMNLTDPNVMAQPSNTDTMGDLMLETLGGVLSVLGCKSARMPLWNKRKTGRSEIQS